MFVCFFSEIDLFKTQLCVGVKNTMTLGHFGVTALILAKAPAIIPTLLLCCQCKFQYTGNGKKNILVIL